MIDAFSGEFAALEVVGALVLIFLATSPGRRVRVAIQRFCFGMYKRFRSTARFSMEPLPEGNFVCVRFTSPHGTPHRVIAPTTHDTATIESLKSIPTSVDTVPISIKFYDDAGVALSTEDEEKVVDDFIELLGPGYDLYASDYSHGHEGARAALVEIAATHTWDLMSLFLNNRHKVNISKVVIVRLDGEEITLSKSP